MFDDKEKNCNNKKIKSKCNFCYVIGPTGPTGISPSLSIGTVTTGAPGTEASASITGNSPDYVLNLTIPEGPTGPANSGVYGRKYSTAGDTVALETNIAQNLPLGSNGPSSGITTATQNALTITEDGTYKVDYYFSGSSSVNSNLTVEVKQGAVPIGSSSIVKSVTANQINDFVGSTINSFNAGDKISLIITSSAAATISPGSGTNTYLNIVKLS